MKRGVLLTAVVLISAFLICGPALAQKVYIEYDAEYDSSKLETFSWKLTPETSLAEQSPFLHSRIVNGLQQYLAEGGLRQVDGDADIQVTYHAKGSEALRLDTEYWGYGYPSAWYGASYWGGYRGPSQVTTTVTKYVEGTLVVDVWDTASQKLVWRGTAVLTAIQDPGVVDKKVDKALAKMVSKWRKIKKKKGRKD